MRRHSVAFAVFVTAAMGVLGWQTIAWTALGTQRVEIVDQNGDAAGVDGSGNLQVTGSVTASGTVTADQGAPALVANGWFVRLSDGVDNVPIAQSNEEAAGDAVPVLPAVVGASAPTLNDGRSAALSMTTGGELRVTGSFTAAGPSSPQWDTDTGTGIAVAGTDDLDANGGADMGASGTRKLRQVVTSSTAQCKWELRLVNNGVAGAVQATWYTSNVAPTYTFSIPHEDYFAITLGAGVDTFRVTATNIEPSGGSTADVAATFAWSS